jgi:hypothetical protein
MNRIQLVSLIFSLPRFLTSSCAAAFATSIFAAVSVGQDPLNQEEVLSSLPASTCMIFSSDNLRSTYEQLAKSDAVAHFSNPNWQKVSKLQQEKQIGSLFNSLPWLGFNWDELATVEHRGMVVGMIDKAGKPCRLLLMKLGADAKKHAFVDHWIKNQGGEKAFVASKLAGNVLLYTTSPKPPATDSVAIAIGSQWTCISSSPAALTQWLNAAKGEAFQPSNLAIQALSQPVPKDSSANILHFWIAPWILFRSYAETSETRLFKSANLFGMSGIEEVAGTFSPPTNDNSSWTIRYDLHFSKPLEKGLALFSFKSGPEVKLPTALSSGLDNATAAYVDVKPWFQGVNHLADQIIDEGTPGGFGVILDSIKSDPEGPRIDVRQDLIYRFGSLMFMGSKTRPDAKNPGEYQRNVVVAISYPDAKQANEILTKLFADDEEIKSEVIGDYRCWYTVHNESLFISLSESDSQTITCAALDSEYIYLSTNTEWFKQLITKTPEPYSDENYTAAQWLPQFYKTASEELSMSQCYDLSSWLKRSWERLPEKSKSKREYESDDLPALIITKTLIPGINEQEIPKWDQIANDLGLVTHSVRNTDLGIKGTIQILSRPTKAAKQ